MKRLGGILFVSIVLAFAGVAYAQEHGGGHAPETTAAPHGEGEHAGGEHAEGHGEHALKPINWADFSDKETRPYAALAINFALLLFLYYRFGKKGIVDALKGRRESIAKDIEEAQRIKKEAAKRAKQYQSKLDKLEEEKQVTRQTLLEAGKGEKERIVKEAEEKAERMKRDALFLLEQELKQLQVDLTRETVEKAVAAAEEMLKQKVTQADHDRAAEEFLTQLASASKPVTSSAGGAS